MIVTRHMHVAGRKSALIRSQSARELILKNKKANLIKREHTAPLCYPKKLIYRNPPADQNLAS